MLLARISDSIMLTRGYGFRLSDSGSESLARRPRLELNAAVREPSPNISLGVSIAFLTFQSQLRGFSFDDACSMLQLPQSC